MKTYQLFISEVHQALASIDEKRDLGPELGHSQKFLGRVVSKGLWSYAVWFGNIKGDTGPDPKNQILVLDYQNDDALAATIVLAASGTGKTLKYTVVSFKVESAYNKKQSEFALPIIIKMAKAGANLTITK